MNYYTEIKEKLLNNEIRKKVKDYSKNKGDLQTYFDVGKLLIEAQGGEEKAKYGNKLIKEYSKKLTKELGRGYSERNLRNMRQFYLKFENKIWQSLPAILSWSHYTELLVLKDINEIKYYINISINQRLSYRELHEKIKSKEYERLPVITKNKLVENAETKVNDFIKNPIVVKNIHNYKQINERMLKELILEDIDNFLMELGEGFCYIGNEYKIKIGNNYNYIDLLLFNYKYNCFVVVELKVTELKKEHIGQIQTYMGYIDKHIKTINQEDTIGILIVKEDNEFIMEYVNRNKIFESEFILN